ncbi:MAG: 50S ribosomal protein L4 [Pseudomonadota bacterium]|nr:50S ribosomal protein L4 [Pseudomonadota bacterium]
MKLPVINLKNEEVGQIELDDAIFTLPVRPDILQRVVTWQLAKRRQGTHKTKGISDISGTTAKPFKQKGTGRARQGSKRAPQLRGGGVVFGPVVRSHAFDLPKKVRKLGLRTALSVKASEGKLTVIDSVKVDTHKTGMMVKSLEAMGFASVLFIAGDEIDRNFELSVRNLPAIDLLPQCGANVYDILRRDRLVLTREAAEKLQERLK